MKRRTKQLHMETLEPRLHLAVDGYVINLSFQADLFTHGAAAILKAYSTNQAGYSAPIGGRQPAGVVNRVPLVASDHLNFGPAAEDAIMSVGDPSATGRIGVLANDVDPDGDLLAVIAHDLVSSRGAAVSVSPNGAFTYDPSGASEIQSLREGEVVEDHFFYAAGDGRGAAAGGKVTLQVQGANDAPTLETNLPAVVQEGAAVVLSVDRLAAADRDDPKSNIVFQILSPPTYGQIELTTAPSVPVAEFTQADVEAGRVVYRHDGSESTADDFVFQLHDGSPAGPVSASWTFDMVIEPVNDPVRNEGTFPLVLAAVEDVASPLDLSGVVLADPDALGGSMTLSLSASGGTIRAAAGAGVSISGDGTPALTISGPLSAINAYLAGAANLQFQGAANLHGPAAGSIAAAINDNGANGAGGVRTTALGNIAINIAPVNDAPENQGALPSTAVVVEDVATPIDLSSVVLDDVDGDELTLTLAATDGVVVAAGGSGVAIVGSGSGSVTLTGGAAALNAYLAVAQNIQFTAAENRSGPGAASLDVALSDGAAAVGLGTIVIDVTAVNDAPYNSGALPATATVVEDVATPIDLSAVVLADVDGDSTLTLSLTATGGALQAASAADVTVVGNATGEVALSGSFAAVNAYLAGAGNVHFLSPADLNGVAAASLALTASDGVATVALGAISIDILAVNDLPTIAGALPATIAALEDQPAAIDLSAIALFDVDGDALSLTLTASAGVLSAAPASGVAATGSGGATLVLQGSADHLSAYLAASSAITYLGHADMWGFGADSIAATVSDGSASVALGAITVDLAAVNDAPLLDGVEASPAAFVAGDAPLQITAGLTTYDADFEMLAGATVRIVAGLAIGEDQLLFTDQNGIAGSYDTAAGVLTLVGAASAANYQAALRSVAYHNAAGPLSAGQRTIELFVNDGMADSNTATRIVSVLNNAPPELSLDADASAGDPVHRTLDFVEGDAPLSLTDGSAIADVDDVTIVSATITLVNPQDGASESIFLAGGPSGGISVDASSTSSTIRLTGAASHAAYAQAIDLVVYANDSQNPAPGQRTIAFVVNDGLDDSAVATATVTVSAVNDDPFNAGSLPTARTVVEDELTAVDLSSLHFADVDAADGAATVTLTAAGGTLHALSSAGVTTGGSGSAVLTFTGALDDLNAYIDVAANISFLGAPDRNGIGAGSIAFRISDNGYAGAGGGADVLLGATTVHITAVNDAPQVVGSLPATLAAVEDQWTPVVLSTLAVSDADGDMLMITLSTAGGTLSAMAGAGIAISGNNTAEVTFTGAAAALNSYLAATGNVHFLGALNLDGPAAASIAGSMSDGSAAMSLGATSVDIAAVNDAPTFAGALPTTLAATEDAPVAVDLSGVTLAEADGDVLVFTLSAAGGTLTAAPGAGVAISGNGGASIVLGGSAATLNAYLATATNVQFTGALNLNGLAAASIAASVSDGLASTPLGSIAIDIAAVNDDPYNAGSLPASLPVVQAVASVINLSSIQIADPDVGSSVMTLTLTANTGVFNALPGAGLAIVGNGGKTLAITGTRENLNSYLALATSLSFLSPLGLLGLNVDVITVRVSDNGATGAGGGAFVTLGTIGVNAFASAISANAAA